MTLRLLLTIAALAALPACDRGAEAPSAEDNRRLDEAGAMLDEAPASLEAIDDSALVDKETAGPNAAEAAPEPAEN